MGVWRSIVNGTWAWKHVATSWVFHVIDEPLTISTPHYTVLHQVVLACSTYCQVEYSVLVRRWCCSSELVNRSSHANRHGGVAPRNSTNCLLLSEEKTMKDKLMLWRFDWKKNPHLSLSLSLITLPTRDSPKKCPGQLLHLFNNFCKRDFSKYNFIICKWLLIKYFFKSLRSLSSARICNKHQQLIIHQHSMGSSGISWNNNIQEKLSSFWK